MSDTDMEVERIVDSEKSEHNDNARVEREVITEVAEEVDRNGSDENQANGTGKGEADEAEITEMAAEATEAPEAPEAQESTPSHHQASQHVGKRAKQTRQLVQMALKHIVDGWSYDNFAQSFPAIAHDAPESLSSMRDQTKDHFEKSVSTSIEALHERRRVMTSLNSLDEMLEEIQRAKRTKGTNFKRKGEKLASDPFLAYRVRRSAVLRQEHEELDERVARARREMDDLVHSIKEMESEEEKGENEKTELERLLGIVSTSSAVHE